jgi:hypothetical protein
MRVRSALCPKEGPLADNSGGVGVLGVLVGALLVIVIAGGLFMFSNGKLGGSGGGNSIKVELPKPK